MTLISFGYDLDQYLTVFQVVNQSANGCYNYRGKNNEQGQELHFR